MAIQKIENTNHRRKINHHLYTDREMRDEIMRIKSIVKEIDSNHSALDHAYNEIHNMILQKEYVMYTHLKKHGDDESKHHKMHKNLKKVNDRHKKKIHKHVSKVDHHIVKPEIQNILTRIESELNSIKTEESSEKPIYSKIIENLNTLYKKIIGKE